MPVLGRLAAEMGPFVVFFAVTRLQGIFWGTAAFMAAAALSTAASWVKERRMPVLPLIGTAFTLLFGALTLWLAEPLFIKIRPTIVNLLMAAALAGSLWFSDTLLLEKIFGAGRPLERRAWRVLSWRLVAFLVALAALNEAVWRLFGQEVWVTFKAFALPGLNLLFLAANWPYVKRHRA